MKPALPGFPARFVPIPTFPDGLSKEFDELNLEEQEIEGFFEAHSKWQRLCLKSQHSEWGGLHQLGGYPHCIQGEVRTEFEMEANGNAGSHDKKLWQNAKENSGQWHLLMQFDSDDDLKVMWGDAGKLYFGIREQDLMAGFFERTRVVGQCY